MSDNPAPVQIVPMAPPPARSGGCMGALVVILLLALGLAFLVILALAAKKGGGAGGPLQKPQDMSEKWVSGEEPADGAKVALIEVEGAIMEEVQKGGFIGVIERPVERIARELGQAAKDEKVKAVLLSVNSPGGSVTASDAIWHELKKFKDETKGKKPLVVHMGAICASGGVYISSPGDWIVCSRTTITGSIGVIMQTVNFSGFMQKFDMKMVTIKAGANKDLLNPTDPVKPEHIEIIQGMIDDAYDLFVTRVADGRGPSRLSKDEVRALADGRIYTAPQALEKKLVDQIGYREDAFAKAKELAGVKEATLFRYGKPPNFFEALSGEAQAALGAAHGPTALDRAVNALQGLESPRLMYMWVP